MILCSALDRLPIHNRLQDERVKRRRQARSRLPRQVSDSRHDEQSAIHCFLAAVALGDGRDGSDHAVYWYLDGRVALGLSSASFNPQAAGYFNLILVVIRFVNRRIHPPPNFLASMSSVERRAATASELLLHALMFALPLVGWAMLSAARYPIVLYGPLHLPPILPHSAAVYAVLRKAHTTLAYLLFMTVIAHFGAVLFHTLIVRDGILDRMALWKVRARQT